MARWVPKEETAFARRLRREMTVAETMVWRALRGSRLAGAKFRRQVPVGPCVTDFLCLDARLVVELDGASRDAWLSGQGFRVLRFSNDLAIGGTEILIRQVEAVLKEGEGR